MYINGTLPGGLAVYKAQFNSKDKEELTNITEGYLEK
jgi:hypothetical protein